ncbi:MAG: hypothetical protein MUP53_07375, partial [Bacteroidales bacterium]|nr:hypothetical protein [Bacteroidales bacterium]
PSGSYDGNLCAIYTGYVSGDMVKWEKALADLEEICRKDQSSYNLYCLADARYGYIGYLMATGNDSEVKVYVDEFERDIEKLAAFPDRQAETEAYRVALLGYRMGLNPLRAVTLGPRALKHLEKAMEAGINEPGVWIEKANSEAHMPALAGGSKLRAAESFRHAISLFESDKEALECNWKYLNTLVLLWKVLEETGDYDEACEAYRKALVKEPSFKWVRDELLPAALKKVK